MNYKLTALQTGTLQNHIIDAEERIVADVYGETVEESRQLASLIAAAPELERALINVREYLFSLNDPCFNTSCNCEANEEPKRVMDLIDSALKAAEGRTKNE